MELNDKRFIYGIWFVPGDGQDFLLTLFREIPERKWKIEYRFRYHADSKAFDSEDKKSWYGLASPIQTDSDEPPAGMLACVEDVIAKVVREYGRPADFIALKCLGSEKDKLLESLGSSQGKADGQDSGGGLTKPPRKRHN